MSTIGRMGTEKQRLINARWLSSRAGGQAEFAKKIQRSEPQVSHLIGKNPTRPIGKRLARHIERCFNLAKGWLDVSHDNVVRLPLSQTEEVPTSKQRHDVGLGPELTTRVPLLAWASVGHWLNDGGEVIEVAKTLLCPEEHSPRTYALEVHGASMQPPFRAGQYIFIDADKTPVTGDYVIAQIGDNAEPIFRRYISEGGEIYLEATNPAWPDRFIQLTAKTHILGVLIYIGLLPSHL